jgi:hypothetical protein
MAVSPFLHVMLLVCMQETCISQVCWQESAATPNSTPGPTSASTSQALEGPPINLAALDYSDYDNDYLVSTGSVGHTTISSSVWGPGAGTTHFVMCCSASCPAN